MKQVIRIKNAADLKFRKYIKSYMLCMLCMVGYTIASLLYPNKISLIVDKGITQSNMSMIILYSSQLLIVGLVMIVFRYLQRTNFAKLSQSVVAEIQIKLMKKLIRVNHQFWTKHKQGDILTIIQNDVGKIESLLVTLISDALVNIMMAVSVGIYLIYIDVLIGTLLILLTVAFAFLQKQLGNKVKKGMSMLREYQGELATYTNEVVNHIPVIQLSDWGKSTTETFSKSTIAYKDKYIKQVKRMAEAQNMVMIYNTLSMFIVLFIGAIKAYNVTMTVGIVFSLTMYVQRLYSPIVNLGNTYVSLKNISPILEKILSVLESNEKIREGNRILSPKECDTIEFKDVNFRYINDRKVFINNLNVKLNKNDIIGLVGKNGSGKTTLIRLLGKLCAPEEGEILLGGRNLDDFNTNSVWAQMSIMPQTVYFPVGTFKDILEINENNYKKANELLNKLNFDIHKFPGGLESKMEVNRFTLSGGEKQKLAFVRVMMQNRSICIFDEPTASLDINSEKKMLEIIQENSKGKICIIITHRPKLLEICTKIIKLGDLE